MEIRRPIPHAGHAAYSSDEMVSALVDVMVDLMEILRAENELLGRGLPAAIVEMTERKAELTDEYADLLLVANRRHAQEIAGDSVLCRRLTEAAGELDAVAKENMGRLEAAMAATRRRIDAVMSAVLAQEAKGRGYGVNGARIMRGLVSSRAAFRA